MKTKTNSLLIGSLLLPVVAVNTYSQKQMDRPNILWLVSEDNTVLLNAYGDSHAKTPVIDGLAKEGTVYENAYCTAPVSAAARSTLITGMYPTALGTQHMRSFNKWPTFLHMYTEYMKKAGYYCVNNNKEDYNTAYSAKIGWDESSKTAYWENRKPGQPFFQIFNFGRTHESSIFDHPKTLHNSPNEVEIPPYLPDLPEERYDRALYYDRLEQMDSELGEVIARLKKEGLYENTIIFYYGDNGGILGRSKRFMYDNGLHIPLIVRFPKKYQYMATTKPGGREKRLVSFVDFAPTMLSLTNCPIPDYMQGKAFLGKAAMPARKYIYAFRGRMDERYDLCRVIHGKRFKYIRNYMPQRPNGQHLDFLWRAKGIQAWEKAWKQGKCTAAQSKFWLPKEPEEFYDIEKDPYELHNLIGNPFYEKELNRLKKNYTAWLLRMRDTGFLPEGMMHRRSKDQSSYDLTHDPAFPFEKILDTADKASLKKAEYFDLMKQRLTDDEPAVRYWAMMGCALRPTQAKSIRTEIKTIAKKDASPDVRIAATEALHAMGQTDEAVKLLLAVVKENNEEFVRLHAFNVADVIGSKAKEIRDYAKKTYTKQDNRRIYDLRLVNSWRAHESK